MIPGKTNPNHRPDAEEIQAAVQEMDEEDEDDDPSAYNICKLNEDIHNREDDLREMKGEIRRSWSKHQSILKKGTNEKGIDELEAKAAAKSHKKSALQREYIYKPLWKEFITIDKVPNRLDQGLPEKRAVIRDRHGLTVRITPVTATIINYERGD